MCIESMHLEKEVLQVCSFVNLCNGAKRKVVDETVCLLLVILPILAYSFLSRSPLSFAKANSFCYSGTAGDSFPLKHREQQPQPRKEEELNIHEKSSHSLVVIKWRTNCQNSFITPWRYP